MLRGEEAWGRPCLPLLCVGAAPTAARARLAGLLSHEVPVLAELCTKLLCRFRGNEFLERVQLGLNFIVLVQHWLRKPTSKDDLRHRGQLDAER